jgi:hypothetical protein
VTYELKVDMPNLSKGQSVGITGLGEFENGKTYVISDEDHDRWQQANAILEDELDDNDLPTGRVVPRSPGTLLTALKNVEGLEIKKVSKDAKGREAEQKAVEMPENSPTAKEGGK